MWWRKPEPKPEFLKPGICQCGHIRSAHSDGVGKCHCDVTDKCSDQQKSRLEHGQFFACACQIYIPKRDDGGGDAPDAPDPEKDEELEELRKMAGVTK
jgi:hypothetical protein